MTRTDSGDVGESIDGDPDRRVRGIDDAAADDFHDVQWTISIAIPTKRYRKRYRRRTGRKGAR